MLSAMRLVMAGGKYLPSELLPPSVQANAPQRLRKGTKTSTQTLGLTGRQTDVLRLVAAGASNKVICRELGLAERTVKAHVTAVLRVLGVSSRTQAAIVAAELGLFGTARKSDLRRDR